MASHERPTRIPAAQGQFIALVAIVLVAALVVTLILRSVTPPPATLGVSTAQVQRQLETVGFQFTVQAIANGIPSIGGSTPDGSVDLVLTGEPGTLMRAVIIVSLPSAPDGNHPVAAAGSANERWMRMFFESVLPQWDEGTAWWRTNATTITSAQTTVASANVILRARQIPSTGTWDMQTCVAPISMPETCA